MKTVRGRVRTVAYLAAAAVIFCVFATLNYISFKKCELLCEQTEQRLSTETLAAAARLAAGCEKLAAVSSGIAADSLCAEVFADCALMKITLSAQEAENAVFALLDRIQTACITRSSAEFAGLYAHARELEAECKGGGRIGIDFSAPELPAPAKITGAEVTPQQAQTAAALFLEIDPSVLVRLEDVREQTACYAFSAVNGFVTVTKDSGRVSTYVSSVHAGEAALSEPAARDRALAFLEKKGYSHLSLRRTQTEDGILTLYLAAERDNIVYLEDEIKIGVALDSGKVTYFDAQRFLAGESSRRSVPENIVAPERAKAALNEGMTSENEQLVFKKDVLGNERLCYEFICPAAGEKYALVYIDAVDLSTRNVEILLKIHKIWCQ